MQLIPIQVKELQGELSEYSNWRGFILDSHQDNALVKIYAPPEYEGDCVDIWLHRTMLVKLSNV